MRSRRPGMGDGIQGQVQRQGQGQVQRQLAVSATDPGGRYSVGGAFRFPVTAHRSPLTAPDTVDRRGPGWRISPRVWCADANSDTVLIVLCPLRRPVFLSGPRLGDRNRAGVSNARPEPLRPCEHPGAGSTRCSRQGVSVRSGPLRRRRTTGSGRGRRPPGWAPVPPTTGNAGWR